MATVLPFQPVEQPAKVAMRLGDSQFVADARRLEQINPRAARVLGRMLTDMINGVPDEREAM